VQRKKSDTWCNLKVEATTDMIVRSHGGTPQGRERAATQGGGGLSVLAIKTNVRQEEKKEVDNVGGVRDHGKKRESKERETIINTL